MNYFVPETGTALVTSTGELVWTRKEQHRTPEMVRPITGVVETSDPKTGMQSLVWALGPWKS